MSPMSRRPKTTALVLVLIPLNVAMGAVPAAIGVAIPLAVIKLVVTGDADIFKTPWLIILIGVAAVIAFAQTVQWFVTTYGDGEHMDDEEYSLPQARAGLDQSPPGQ